MSEALLEVKDLKMHFPLGRGRVVKAVDGVSFSIAKGETLGLVGESGCGKSTCGRTVLGLYRATAGSVLFDGSPVHSHDKKARRAFVRQAQMIFQDPYSSLDPRMTIHEIVREGLDVHSNLSQTEKRTRILSLLDRVGLTADHARRFPHELSGGQRQRIGIARALAVEPSFIVCDEPISALDVSVQSQIINLLIRLQQEMGLTYLFISHDLAMVRHISDRVGVMYLGSLVEIGTNLELCDAPLHPYSRALMSARSKPNPHARRPDRLLLEGEIPSPMDIPSGCRFRTRCPQAQEICARQEPGLRQVSPGRLVACHLIP